MSDRMGSTDPYSYLMTCAAAASRANETTKVEETEMNRKFSDAIDELKRQLSPTLERISLSGTPSSLFFA